MFDVEDEAYHCLLVKNQHEKLVSFATRPAILNYTTAFIVCDTALERIPFACSLPFQNASTCDRVEPAYWSTQLSLFHVLTGAPAVGGVVAATLGLARGVVGPHS